MQAAALQAAAAELAETKAAKARSAAPPVLGSRPVPTLSV